MGNERTQRNSVQSDLPFKKGDEVQVDEIRITEGVYILLKPMTRYFLAGDLDVKNGRFEVNEAVEDKSTK